ncbi:ArsR family transcriptional regulator [Streptomyces inhibens]|uniref:ArsR family transcriptional regulator n=1 Tax=Streptomyces inhibens TaxID=2293571 RepID=A0A371Q491_STRIH|nr:helix-turn-helix domain-containing protein [Streptomyces inhibens]REK89507.1 ArsR family transcriptional regulator [Streptomyces inhibens]
MSTKTGVCAAESGAASASHEASEAGGPAAEVCASRPGFVAARRPVPADAPEPLPEPERADLRLEVVMGALSDPLRMRIVRTLLLESEAFDHTCGWFGLDRPKSSLTHHFRALRDAGLIRQRQYGLERRSHVRVDDLEARFPGLLALVADWRE